MRPSLSLFLVLGFAVIFPSLANAAPTTDGKSIMNAMKGHTGHWGRWAKGVSRCPKDTFAYAFRQRVERRQGKRKDDTALNAVQLSCRPKNGGTSKIITSKEGPWGKWSKWRTCPQGQFLVGFDIRVEPKQGKKDDTAANDLRFLCSKGKGKLNTLVAGNGTRWGTWRRGTRCGKNQLITGFRTQIEPKQGPKDDTALNGLKVLCTSGVNRCLHEPRARGTRCVSRLIQTMKRSKPPSISAGTPTRGTLRFAARLPNLGLGYRIIERDPKRFREYGHDRMIYGLMYLGASMHQEIRGSVYSRAFSVGDISTKKGGKQLDPDHLNHQQGLDVDLGLYVRDKDGRRHCKMVSLGRNGRTEKGSYAFDAEANWQLVVGMLKNPYFKNLRRIFLADWLKRRLLRHARAKLERVQEAKRKRRLENLIEQADTLISQPSSSPHDNHFHVSL